MLPNDVMLLLVTHTGFKMAFINVLTFLASVYIISSTYGLSGEIVSYSDPTYCAENEYFDMQLLKCISCNELKNLIPTEDSELLLIIHYDQGYFCDRTRRDAVPKLFVKRTEAGTASRNLFFLASILRG